MGNIIGVFDSGIGGMTTKLAIEQLIPQAKVIYYGDSANCPYGERSQAELIQITTRIVESFQQQNAKIIVIACNTATTQCIHALRQRFPDLTFIGTEPAIKVACDNHCNNILLMATSGTVKSLQVQRLINKFVTDQKVSLLPCPGLADLIEKSATFINGDIKFHNMDTIHQKLDTLIKNIPDRNQTDAVVLGCTHYIYLKPEIQKYFPNAKLLDGNYGVAKRTHAILKRWCG